MGKTGKWLKSFLTGKKDKEKEKCTSNQNYSNVTENPTTPPLILPTTPKEKRRWSFRRSSTTAAAAAPKDFNSPGPVATTPQAIRAPKVDGEDEKKKHALAVAAATAAAANAAVAAAQAAAALIRLTAAGTDRASTIEEAAAIKIQSVFRSHLARKALCALKGLVKLQALIRGHLVRKQATATLRCMQALVTVQARAQAQRIQMTKEPKPPVSHRQSVHRKSSQESRFRLAYHEIDRGMEENIKIVEMDQTESKGSSKSRNSYSSHPLTERAEHRFSTQYASHHAYRKQDNHEVSPTPSVLTDMSPRACSGHFEDYSYSTAQSSPQNYSAGSKPDPSRVPFAFPRQDYAESLSYDLPLFPNYMANTESSRAKARSQSAPKSRPDSFERQPSQRRVSVEGRNIPRAVRMQRSSSHLGATAENIHYPWSIKLDRSTVSLKDIECGVLTGTNYCRSLDAYDHHGNRY